MIEKLLLDLAQEGIGCMPVFRKHNNWWIDYYYLGRRYRQLIGTRKKDAEDTLSQIKARIAIGTFVSPTERKEVEEAKPAPITFTDFADTDFRAWSKEQHSEKSHIRLISMIQCHLKPVFGKQSLSEITRKQIEDYLIRRKQTRYKRGRKSFQTSEATINRELSGLKVVLRKAVEWGLLEVSVAHGIPAFKEKNSVPQLLEKEEVARFLEEVPPHFHALVACAVYAGLRREELFHLRWEDIHWQRRELVVASNREHHTKNYESRRIPMNDALVVALQAHKTNHLILGSPYVFSNREGKSYTDIREPLNDAALRAGISGSVKLHQLRHAFCSHALMSGIDPRTVQKWMGHKDLKTTLRYAHVSPDHEKAAIERLQYDARPKDSTDEMVREMVA